MIVTNRLWQLVTRRAATGFAFFRTALVPLCGASCSKLTRKLDMAHTRLGPRLVAVWHGRGEGAREEEARRGEPIVATVACGVRVQRN